MKATDGSMLENVMLSCEEPRGGLAVAVWATLKRDLVLLMRRRSEVLNPLVFFAIVITLFPIGISPDPALLAAIAPGLLWVAALLAALLSLDSLFRADFDDGSLEQLLLTPQPLPLLVLAKVAVHWLLTGLPLALMAPLLGLMLALPAGSYVVLAVSLALGSAESQPDWCHRSGADGGAVTGRRAALPAGTASLHSGADLRCWSRAGGHLRRWRAGASINSRRAAGAGLDLCTLGNRGIAAHQYQRLRG